MIANIPLTDHMSDALDRRIDWLKHRHRQYANVDALIDDIVYTNTLWETGHRDALPTLPSWGHLYSRVPGNLLILPRQYPDQFGHVSVHVDVMRPIAKVQPVLLKRETYNAASEFYRMGNVEDYIQLVLCRELRIPCKVVLFHINAV